MHICTGQNGGRAGEKPEHRWQTCLAVRHDREWRQQRRDTSMKKLKIACMKLASPQPEARCVSCRRRSTGALRWVEPTCVPSRLLSFFRAIRSPPSVGTRCARGGVVALRSCELVQAGKVAGESAWKSVVRRWGQSSFTRKMRGTGSSEASGGKVKFAKRERRRQQP